MSNPHESDSPTAHSLYRDAGVDLRKAIAVKERIRQLARGTFTAGVVDDIGNFGALFSLADIPTGDAVLVSSADGVGTKLKIAFAAGRHDTVGRDLVAHCVNDILTQGARPLFFLDYIATGKLEIGVVEQVVTGLSEECRATGCALVGGETAQMPDFYAPGEYDLAGFIVGWALRGNVLGPARVRPGDVLLGLSSSGLHTNGYSLARRILLEKSGLRISDPLPEAGCTVADELLKVHRCYLRPVEALLADESLHAIAHITGGGITENLPRVLPAGLAASIRLGSWPELPIFAAMRERGAVPDDEMFRVFNMGIGLILVVAADGAGRVQSRLQSAGEISYRIGVVVPGSTAVDYSA